LERIPTRFGYKKRFRRDVFYLSKEEARTAGPSGELEGHEEMAIDAGRAGGPGGRVVVDAGALDVRPKPRRRGIVRGKG
jgi:hypothetical protein